MSVELLDPSKQEHDSYEIQNQVKDSDPEEAADAAFFNANQLEMPVDRAHINGHGVTVPLTDRILPFTVESSMRQRLEIVTQDSATNLQLLLLNQAVNGDRTPDTAINLGFFDRNGNFYDDMRLCEILPDAAGRISIESIAVFAPTDLTYSSVGKETPLFVDIPVKELYGPATALPKNWEETAAAKAEKVNLLRALVQQLVQIQEIKAA
jgi:hypothetical protein